MKNMNMILALIETAFPKMVCPLEIAQLASLERKICRAETPADIETAVYAAFQYLSNAAN